jgi:predicted GNAT superfamily acetyltransferase
MLPWRSNKYYIFSLCVLVRVCVGNRARGRMHVRARVALLTQNARRMRYIVICDLSGSAIFFDIIT